MGKVMYMRKGEVHTSPPLEMVGTVWLFEQNGEWEAPVTGLYQIEMHGGGGGAGGAGGGSQGLSGAGGGGSGELCELQITSGTSVPIIIGEGGAGGAKGANVLTDGESGRAGGTTYFGELLSLAGGSGGAAYAFSGSGAGGAASGSLASAGTNIDTSSTVKAGGEGNINNTAQTYGDGGSGVLKDAGAAGQPGAVIITYLGKE